MTRLLQVMGAVLIVFGVRSLLQSDWLMFMMFFALGVSLLIGPKGSKSLQGLRKTLIFVVFVLVIIRLLSLLTG